VNLARLSPVAAQLWILTFTAFFGSYVTTAIVSLRVPTQLVFVFPVLAWSIIRLRRAPDAIDLAILLALAANAIVSLTSLDPLGSL